MFKLCYNNKNKGEIMVLEIMESERLVLKPFNDLTPEQKIELGKSWKNPFNARFNGQKKPFSAVENLSKRN